jgi:serine/threonine protein kinase
MTSLISHPVLFSRSSRAWKLADFGLTSQGTSQTVPQTDFARGTPGYRAPELLMEDNYVFNNKVDIWAAGCILYELVFGKPAFPSDAAVLEHRRSGNALSLQFDEAMDETFKRAISSTISSMLELSMSARPSAVTLYERFSHYQRASDTEPQPNILTHVASSPARGNKSFLTIEDENQSRITPTQCTSLPCALPLNLSTTRSSAESPRTVGWHPGSLA